ncbi:tyrosine-type recombinase/integrase [uncultured Oscillibacter sp.]|uniref:tyrosine-type recombinase/integrase n=1 Tax=uncultured Oscillibacter sp. TaxID=876091 RepID=UPI0025CFF34E|nr:tyrosine-type recombinase/integrase [uncultured Oscillibacter sp.]
MKHCQLTPGRISAYEKHLRREERAPATVTKYLRAVRELAAFLDGRPVTKENLLEWKERLLSAGLSPATVNGRLSALSGLLRFLGREDCRVKFLRLQRRTFRERELTRMEYLRLLETARETGRERLALLMEAICSTGIRVSEVRFLTVEAAEQGRAVVRLKGKVRTILLPGKLRRKLLKFARKQKTASGEIFLTEGGKSVSRRQIWREMKSLCSRAGVEKAKVFPHNLRHLFAATFYRVCRDIVKLADLLGHSSIDTTRTYLLTSGQEHIRCLERLRLIC